jgi:hypothetical protein
LLDDKRIIRPQAQELLARLSIKENYPGERPLKRQLHCDNEDEKGDADDA